MISGPWKETGRMKGHATICFKITDLVKWKIIHHGKVELKDHQNMWYAIQNSYRPGNHKYTFAS